MDRYRNTLFRPLALVILFGKGRCDNYGLYNAFQQSNFTRISRVGDFLLFDAIDLRRKEYIFESESLDNYFIRNIFESYFFFRYWILVNVRIIIYFSISEKTLHLRVYSIISYFFFFF